MSIRVSVCCVTLTMIAVAAVHTDTSTVQVRFALVRVVSTLLVFYVTSYGLPKSRIRAETARTGANRTWLVQNSYECERLPLEYMQTQSLLTCTLIPGLALMSVWMQPKALSTLSQKSPTVAEFGDCRRCLAVFCDSRTFLRQCGQGLSLLPVGLVHAVLTWTL